MDKVVRFADEISSSKKCVIEFQAFRNNHDKFIIKELTFLDVSTNVVNYFLFKPPFPFKKFNSKSYRTNTWLTKYLHHIEWEEGFTHYKELDSIMYHYCQQYDEIYTTGDEKAKWIRMYSTSDVINITLSKDFATDLNGLCIGVKCSQHKTANCALSRAYRVCRFITSGGGKSINTHEETPLISVEH
jgi:hypothetical protein